MNSRELCTYVGVIGGAIAGLFGGWDTALQTLVIFMAVDYITGLIVAGVFHTSPKTKTGTLESRAGWKGLCRKGVSLLVVLVACRLDAIIGSSFIRDATVIAFVCNETISIIENAGLMGVPVPKVLRIPGTPGRWWSAMAAGTYAISSTCALGACVMRRRV